MQDEQSGKYLKKFLKILTLEKIIGMQIIIINCFQGRFVKLIT